MIVATMIVLSLFEVAAFVYLVVNASRLIRSSAPWTAWKQFISSGLDLAIAVLIFNQIGPWSHPIANLLKLAFVVAFAYFGISVMNDARREARLRA